MGREQSGSTQLVADLDVTALLATRYKDVRLEDRLLDERGNLYDLILDGTVHCELSVGLYGSVMQAVNALKRPSRKVTHGPQERPPPVGDERKVWWSPDPTGGSILFRRANALVRVKEMSNERERLELARFLDHAMSNAGEHVKLAASVSPPRIAKLDLPSKLRPSQTHRAAIEVENIDPLDALIAVVGPVMLVEKKPDPVLIFEARPSPGEQRFLLVISSPGNLFSTKEVVVQVEEDKDSAQDGQNP